MSTETLKQMNRREAVRRIALLMGTAMVASEAILRGGTVPGKESAAPFTDADRKLLDAVGDTIVPETDIPGAKDVGIGAFMTMMVTDCYNPQQHAAFAEGLAKINEACRAKFSCGFLDATPVQRLSLCNGLDAEQMAYNRKREKDAPAHYFRMMKELTVLGFYSSEIGATKAVKYVEVPGAFHGDYPYKKGDRAWY
ncbi:MAG TPA: gluconate 2-dehydrogenase subunit 3 family protein [Opitutaceae bacterium]|jgi:hypothetical protein